MIYICKFYTLYSLPVLDVPKIRALEVCFGEVRAPEVCFGEVRVREVCFGEVRGPTIDKS